MRIFEDFLFFEDIFIFEDFLDFLKKKFYC